MHEGGRAGTAPGGQAGGFLPRAKLLFPLLFLCAAVQLHPQAYTILAEDAAGLWGQRDGTGCGNDIVRAAFAASGIRISLEVAPYNRVKKLVLTGKALAGLGMSWSEELRGKVVFPQEAIYTNTCTVFVRKAEASRFRTAGDIPSGSPIGTVLGYEYPPAFAELVRLGKLVPDPALSEEKSLQKLAMGRLDLVAAMLDSLKSDAYLLGLAGVGDRVVAAFTLGGSATYLGFSALNPETPAAIAAFDRGMRTIARNGRLDAIIAAWKAGRGPRTGLGASP
jgi:ABC-type amino acid transport substrate-binding protein